MVNNSTIIIKTNNHLLPQLIEHNIKKNTMTYDIGYPGPGFGQAQKCGGVKPVNATLPR